MRRSRLVGLIVSVVTAGALFAAPAFAAGSVQVQLQFDAATLQAPGTDLTNGGAVTTPQLNPCRQGGGTFADTSVNSTGFPAGQQYTPQGSPVAFLMPASATGNNALCLGLGGTGAGAITGKNSVTINVPAGNYTDAYFLAAVGNGPSLVDIVPMYGSTAGTKITQAFPDWCQTTTPVGNSDPPGVSAGWNGGTRIDYNGKADGNAALTCGYYTVHVSGLDSSKQLTALQLTMEPANTPIPAATGGTTKDSTQNAGAVLNIMALTLQGSAAAGASLPKTGGNQIGIIIGTLLLLAGAALAIRPRFARSER
jgi:hypothetical protein